MEIKFNVDGEEELASLDSLSIGDVFSLDLSDHFYIKLDQVGNNYINNKYRVLKYYRLPGLIPEIRYLENTWVVPYRKVNVNLYK